MSPIHMNREQLRQCLLARRRTVKKDLQNPRVAPYARHALIEMNRRLRCELEHGARRRY